MEPVKRKILEQVLAGTLEPVVVVHVDQPDWPVALALAEDTKGKWQFGFGLCGQCGDASCPAQRETPYSRFVARRPGYRSPER